MSESTGRRWLELSVRCPPSEEAALLVVDALLALGGRAAEERDGRLVTHLAAPADLEAFLAAAGAALGDAARAGDLDVRGVWREHEEWSETWKRGLGPRRITDRILVQPSWLPAPVGPPEATIILDPGMAFGTAEHGTTRGCLRLLDVAVRPGDRLLDVGAGSGVLAIAAVLLGAVTCVAIEADPLSCEALRENLERNRVADRVRCVEATAGADDLARLGPVEGVVANIETGILRPLLAGFRSALAPSGWLILSGILAAEWADLRADAERAGLRFLALDADGDWRSALFERGA